jgi:hypothetical protein
MLAIRQKQMQVFENLTLFEQRILCHELPNSFDSINTHNSHEQCVNKRNKMTQELKRQMLNSELEKYEMKIQHYEDLYERELETFQSEIYKTGSSYQIDHRNEIIYSVKIYVYHHTEMLLRRIRYKESCFRVKLLRHHRRRQHSFPSSNTIDVYPQIIVDLPKVSLSKTQLDYLSQTGRLEIQSRTYTS